MLSQTLKLMSLIVVGLVLSGCFDSHRTTDAVCEDNPELACDKLNADGQCRVTRVNLIWWRYENKTDQSMPRYIGEYERISDYSQCLSVAIQIEPKSDSRTKVDRVKAFDYAMSEKSRIESIIRASNTAEAYYFLWSQLGDRQAKNQFIKLEGTPALEKPQMQYALATYYTTSNLEKAMGYLHRSLELSNEKTAMPVVYSALASLYYKQNQYEASYVWTSVAKLSDKEKVAENQMLNVLFEFPEEEKERLEEQAETFLDNIHDGIYKRPKSY
ncbi:DUF2989 domain-containing protein [Vibrio sp.]|nr:DUF2989 domain-containing protein [Vibrio sp.]